MKHELNGLYSLAGFVFSPHREWDLGFEHCKQRAGIQHETHMRFNHQVLNNPTNLLNLKYGTILTNPSQNDLKLLYQLINQYIN